MASKSPRTKPEPSAPSAPSKPKGPGRGRRKGTPPPEPSAPGDAEGESSEVALLLGQALRDLRARYADSQDSFASLVGRSQSYLSNAERGETGWHSVNQWALAVKRAGGDPVDLLRLAVAHAEPDPELQKVLQLWPLTNARVRGAILALLHEFTPKTAESPSEGK